MSMESAQRAAVQQWIRKLSRQQLSNLCAFAVTIEKGSVRVEPEQLRDALRRTADDEPLDVHWTAQ